MTPTNRLGDSSVPQDAQTTVGSGDNLVGRLEAFFDRASQRLNPILVKEARQALKSREFLTTFGLLLICGWGWSLAGVQIQSPQIYYAAGGQMMFFGYYLILAFPLLVIVPFQAFRSLAAEREDGTYELLSITTLKASRIIGGKLSSAVMQMLVYLSALSPCIAFTYLLRGVDILMITISVGAIFLVSILLSCNALLFAALSRNRHWQVAWMMLLMASLGTTFFTAIIAMVGFSMEGGGILPYDEPGFWIAIVFVLSIYASYFALSFTAASARLSFASENRSTRLRIVMLVQQLLLIGWCSWIWLVGRDDDAFYPYFILGALHWSIMGALMTGESPVLSQRVLRSLPQSLLGRALGAWFNPGPGTGYMFAVSNLFVILALGLLAGAISTWIGFSGAPRTEHLYWVGVLLFCYMTVYLGVGRLLIQFISRFTLVQPFGAFFLHIVLVLVGAMVPWSIQMALYDQMGDDYSILQVANLPWTLGEMIDNGRFHTRHPETLIFMTLTAAAVFFLNIFATTDEVRYARTETPQRVQEEEAQLDPERHRVPQRPKSPWDEV